MPVCENVYGKVDKPKRKRGCPRGVMVKAMDCGIVVSEFELQSRYEPPHPPSYGLNSFMAVLLG